MKLHTCIAALLLSTATAFAQTKPAVQLIPIGKGWASNSINVVSFRKNSLVTYRDVQYAAYYDSAHYVVLAKRKLNSSVWEVSKTQYQGNVLDAHNSISIMVDGAGYLHVSWDHHSYGKHLTALNYCKSLSAGSLKLSDKLTMTGVQEDKVTYPEFHKLPNGDLLFFFRDGESGNGNIVLNRYSLKTGTWKRVQTSFIDGEDLRNPYWQIVVDQKGTIHLSWTWRESPDAASNHDLCYAKSLDGGLTWLKSSNEKYTLPIREATAEYILKIPQHSELINQTSMCTDAFGAPYIATYWKEKGGNAPQYHLLYFKDHKWTNLNLGFRKQDFSINGGGTKGIPIARPQVITWTKAGKVAVGMLFRDEERGGKASIAICYDLSKPKWECLDLLPTDLGSWEPTYDINLWQSQQVLNLFIQKVTQKDNDGKAALAPQTVSVLEWKPSNAFVLPQGPEIAQVVQQFPAKYNPVTVGNQVAERFTASPHVLFGPTIAYSEVCTWYGALKYAELSKNPKMTGKLVQRYTPFFGADQKLMPLHDNVDHSVFGALPLELYLQTKEEKYLNKGKVYAYNQWTVPAGAKLSDSLQNFVQQGYSWHTRLWIDDMYMITLLQVQAYRATGNEIYLNRAAKEMVFYLKELQKANGLFYHAPDVPFYWGRGNGWMAAGMTEMLKSLPQNSPERPAILKGYQTMMKSLLKYQSAEGMWRQLIDDAGSWGESSSTGMFTYAMINGVKNGWLKDPEYLESAKKGWTALVDQIDEKGDVKEVCEGTNKKNDRQYYLDRKRITGDFHGQAPVLWCAFAWLEK